MDRLIIDYLPGVLKEVREIQAITSTEQIELSDLWDFLTDGMNDQFIVSANEYGIVRMEKILGILPKGTDTLEDRRFRVLGRLNAQLPYTYTRLEEMLKSLCGESGYSLVLQNEIYTLCVRVALTVKKSFDEVDNLLKQMCPANMVINLTLMYNQHLTLSNYMHAQLQLFTHYELRNNDLSAGVTYLRFENETYAEMEGIISVD